MQMVAFSWQNCIQSREVNQISPRCLQNGTLNSDVMSQRSFMGKWSGVMKKSISIIYQLCSSISLNSHINSLLYAIYNRYTTLYNIPMSSILLVITEAQELDWGVVWLALTVPTLYCTKQKWKLELLTNLVEIGLWRLEAEESASHHCCRAANQRPAIISCPLTTPNTQVWGSWVLIWLHMTYYCIYNG